MLSNIGITKLICNCFMSVLWFFYFDQMLPRRYSVKKTVVIGLISGVSWVLPGMMIYIPSVPMIVQSAIHTATLFLACRIAFVAKWPRYCLVVILLLVAMEFGEFSALFITMSLGVWGPIEQMPLPIFLLAMIMHILVQVILLSIFVVFSKRNTYSISSRSMLLYALFIISQFLSGVCLIWMMARNEVQSLLAGTVFIVVLNFFADIVLYAAICYTKREQIVRAKNQYLRQREKIQMEHYEELRQQYGKLRVLRHDILGHLHTIQILAERGDYEQATAYTSKFLTYYENLASESTSSQRDRKDKDVAN